ncbi:putative LRR receptor-like serine/threonine-protein kinase RKF3 [Glycine max]|nr:putative LRR receptor-like serine/threonine-protein kinase RKF3 [Glycine max]
MPLFVFLVTIFLTSPTLSLSVPSSCPLNTTLLPSQPSSATRCHYILRAIRILQSDYLRRTGLFFPPSNYSFSFTFDEIKKATSSFAGDNIIGKGGYGNVYKGVLFDGTQVALKRFKNCSVAGDASFTHEVEVIASVRHVNLVALRGTAKGLAYLHYGAQPSIIHRDIKASNILLDHNFEAKVADFGLAKFNPEGMTHMSTGVAGTKGYVAPEYALYGQLTDRSDVFSFGVVLLELFSGKKALHVENDGQPSALTDLAWSLVRYGETLDVIEDGMPELGPTEVLEKYVLVVVQCCHPQLYARPTMDQGVKMLETEEVEQPISCIAGRTDIDEKSVASN